jgi:hypothetical protein
MIKIPIEFKDEIVLRITEENRLELTIHQNRYLKKDVTFYINREQLDKLIAELIALRDEVLI